MIRLVQLHNPEFGRKIALVKEPRLFLLNEVESIYTLAKKAIRNQQSIEALVQQLVSTTSLEYNPVYYGASSWQLLPCFDHPSEPIKCMISGTGLTHKSSAQSRDGMHGAKNLQNITDSMRMFIMGTKGGKPLPDDVGVQPEWFFKGHGVLLKGHRDRLVIPEYGENGGDEPEIAGLYICDEAGKPFRVGFATGNEFSDHVMEKRNYLYLAPSKIRQCAIGPEVVIGMAFTEVKGSIRITRSGEELWSKDLLSGEEHMCHSLANLEHHHFKYEINRQPGLAHIHFLGADSFSYGDGVVLREEDEMEVQWDGMGRSLKNKVSISFQKESMMHIRQL